MLTTQDTTNQGARNSLSVNVGVKAFNDVAIAITGSPYGLRDVALGPAHGLKGKFAASFIMNPVCAHSQVVSLCQTSNI